MKTYPVWVPRDSYRGHNPLRLVKKDRWDRLAARIQMHINSDLAGREDGLHTYYSDFIALELGEDPELVREIVFGIDCGHNGVTILKGVEPGRGTTSTRFP